MKTLPYKLDVNGFAEHLARLTLLNDEPFYVANSYADVRDAIAEGAPFEAHAVVGLKPKPVTILPSYVVKLEDLR